MKIILRTAIFSFLFFISLSTVTFADVQRVYDDANLFTAEQIEAFEQQADEYFAKWNADFIIITTEEAGQLTTRQFMEDFTDELAEQFNRAEDNMVAITINMKTYDGYRDVFISGFGLAEEYIDDSRVELILDRVYPHLSNEDFNRAIEVFFEKADEYLEIRPGVNPESIFFNTFFQLAIAVALGGIIVFLMAYSSGGRVTVTSGTYLDRSNSQIISERDRYLRKTVTRRKKPSSNNKGGGGFGGGGGGITGGGRSYSGGGRRF